MSEAERQFNKIKRYLEDVELFESLGIGEDGFVEEVMPMIKKYSQLVKAESVKSLINSGMAIESIRFRIE